MVRRAKRTPEEMPREVWKRLDIPPGASCGRKKKYSSRAAAFDKANVNYKKKGILLDYYFCHYCASYHLTKRTPGVKDVPPALF